MSYVRIGRYVGVWVGVSFRACDNYDAMEDAPVIMTQSLATSKVF